MSTKINSSIKNICFVNNSSTIGEFGIDSYDENPGIGGTEYVTIKLITKLAYLNKPIQFSLISDQRVTNHSNLKNINIVRKTKKYFDICIVPNSQYSYFKSKKISYEKLILWSHHPHDLISNGLKKINHLISLGEYQYFSNISLAEKHYLIRNPYPKPIPLKQLKRIRVGKVENFVFLGSIGPAKGLHLILDMWPQIRKKFKKSKLNIIGGNLYREEKRNSKINRIFPTYEKILEKKLSRMNKSDKNSVNFLGLLSPAEKNKILKNSDIAILNPTGKSEAAPASPLECYCYGIPVIAGGDYGAYDNMKQFPELDLKKQNLKQIIKILKSEKQILILKKKAYDFADSNFIKNKNIINEWAELINGNFSSPKIELPNYLKLKIKVREIYYRNFKYPLKSLINLIK